MTDDARQDEGVITDDGIEANSSKAKPTERTYWSRGPPIPMARQLQAVLLTCTDMVTAYKEVSLASVMIMMILICCANGLLGSKVEADTDYEMVDDDPIEQDVSALPAEADEKKGNFLSKLRERLKGMIQIKKGLTIDSGAADHVMPLGWLVWILVVASAGSLRGLHYVAASGTRIPNMGQQTVKILTQNGTWACLLYTSPSPRDQRGSRMPSSA